jgi:hypothetical protein
MGFKLTLKYYFKISNKTISKLINTLRLIIWFNIKISAEKSTIT